MNLAPGAVSCMESFVIGKHHTRINRNTCRGSKGIKAGISQHRDIPEMHSHRKVFNFHAKEFIEAKSFAHTPAKDRLACIKVNNSWNMRFTETVLKGGLKGPVRRKKSQS